MISMRSCHGTRVLLTAASCTRPTCTQHAPQAAALLLLLLLQLMAALQQRGQGRQVDEGGGHSCCHGWVQRLQQAGWGQRAAAVGILQRRDVTWQQRRCWRWHGAVLDLCAGTGGLLAGRRQHRQAVKVLKAQRACGGRGASGLEPQNPQRPWSGLTSVRRLQSIQKGIDSAQLPHPYVLGLGMHRLFAG